MASVAHQDDHSALFVFQPKGSGLLHDHEGPWQQQEKGKTSYTARTIIHGQTL